MNWKEEENIYDLRNNIQKDLKLLGLGYTDFNRKIVIETNTGETIIPVKEIYYEAKPNTCVGATERIIKDYTEQLGWEYIKTEKQAWVNGFILHHIYFKKEEEEVI